MQSDTTNISDLPSNNITNTAPAQQLQSQEQPQNMSQMQQTMPQMQQTMPQMQQTMPQNEVIYNQTENYSQQQNNEISLEQAQQMGLTNLEERSVRFDTSNLTTDAEANADYIPDSEQQKYIENNMSSQDVRNLNSRYNNKLQSITNIYDEMQGPLLSGILFFLFQLPYFNNLFSKAFPSFFKSDGNIKLNGLICMALIYSTLYYLLNYVIDYASNI